MTAHIVQHAPHRGAPRSLAFATRDAAEAHAEAIRGEWLSVVVFEARWVA